MVKGWPLAKSPSDEQHRDQSRAAAVLAGGFRKEMPTHAQAPAGLTRGCCAALQALCRRLPQPVCEGCHPHPQPPRRLPGLIPHAWCAGRQSELCTGWSRSMLCWRCQRSAGHAATCIYGALCGCDADKPLPGCELAGSGPSRCTSLPPRRRDLRADLHHLPAAPPLCGLIHPRTALLPDWHG
jgi:hypothetical protein